MDEALAVLQECSRVYLAVDQPQDRIRLEDGSYGVFSPNEDPIMAAMEFLTLQNIHFSRDPEELEQIPVMFEHSRRDAGSSCILGA
jgi:hypothetical protein